MQTRAIPAYLIYQSENGAEQRFDLLSDETTIGRKEDRGIVLQCPLIGKEHGSIVRSAAG